MDESDWIKLLQAALLGGMIFFLYPRVKQALKESPKGSSSDWTSLLLPILAVIGFVVLLILSV